MAILSSARLFSPAHSHISSELYYKVRDLPLVCPHGHVDASIFSNQEYSFGSPVDLLILPDHYILRMLYSQGVSLNTLGVTRHDGLPAKIDHLSVWKTFAEYYKCFLGTPTGSWLAYELESVFGIDEELNPISATHIYEQITERLNEKDFTPRNLFEKFKIEVLATTDAGTTDLQYHQAIQDSGWSGHVIPTFRPDSLFSLGTPGWKNEIAALGELCGMEIGSYATFIHALEQRRGFFRRLGAVATDHAVVTPYTGELASSQAETIFGRALRSGALSGDEELFNGHMLMEMARMSVEDGMVMQLHAGAYRNHNNKVFDDYGADKGGDIPVQVEFTRNLRPLLNKYGNDLRLTLILFTLDETSYSRELAPLAGHYPAVKIGPPWWFHDSPNGIRRYLDQVMETAGLYNLAGFNDDTRAFCSIPARHDVWRRASADWLGGLVASHVITLRSAEEMILELAVGLARRTYHL